MSDLEKINIYVPSKIGKQLLNDAKLFEILKSDGKINRNHFLSKLLLGYYNSYATKCHESLNKIIAVLSEFGITEINCHEISNTILKSVVLPNVPSRKGKNPICFSLKPTSETESMIRGMIHSIGDKDSVSQYLCRMLMSYCEKALPEREQIVFKSNYDFLSKVCEKQSPIEFHTIWDKNTIHRVIPYRLEIGKEEMCNYLLCAESNLKTGKQEAQSYRLNRLAGINYTNLDEHIEEPVLGYLDKMIQYGPAYSINDSEDSCVRLTKNGVKTLNRVYYGRPQDYSLREEADAIYCDVKGSKNQVFLYFRRFGEDAEIISPTSLRDRMFMFHEGACENYREANYEHP